MNSPFVHDRAEAMAKRLRRETKNDQAFIEKAFRYCYGREPTIDELARVNQFLQSADHDDKNTSERFGYLVNCCQALISTAEFRVLD